MGELRPWRDRNQSLGAELATARRRPDLVGGTLDSRVVPGPEGCVRTRRSPRAISREALCVCSGGAVGRRAPLVAIIGEWRRVGGSDRSDCHQRGAFGFRPGVKVTTGVGRVRARATVLYLLE